MDFSQLTIGKRISGGFSILIIFFIITGGISYFGITTIVKNAKAVIEGNRLDSILAQKEVDHLNWVNKINALLTDENITELNLETNDHKCGFGKWLYGEGRKAAENQVPALSGSLKAIESPHKKLHESAIAIKNQFRQTDTTLGTFLREKKIDHLMWTHKVKNALLNKAEHVDVELDFTKCGLGHWLYSEKVNKMKQNEATFNKIVSNMYLPHQKLHQSAKEIGHLLKNREFEKAWDYYNNNTSKFESETLSVLNQLLSWHEEQLKGMYEASLTYTSETIPALKSVQKLLREIRETARDSIISDTIMISSANRTQKSTSIIGVVAVFICITLALIIVRSVSKILKMVTSGLENSSIQLNSASTAISQSSQHLAESASEQAATIEETSSSIEEISSMSVSTADLTRGAEELMRQNIESSGQSLKAIVDITSSIAQIENESDEIGHIISNIDQIAFQTNLLALNAAVEAARAGEAGQGFAVVADEVRNLSKRAADAAKNTQDLLNGTINRISQISGAIKKMNKNFEEIVESATIIGEKTAAITSASEEQAEGIKQISTATHQIETVTQKIAATAEESAAAAEELNAQSVEMQVMVCDLKRFVYGATQTSGIPEKQIKSLPTPREEIANHAPAAG